MAIRTTLNVSLSVELGNFIADRVKSGRYRTASEVVRASLRLLEQQEKAASESSSPHPPIDKLRGPQ